MSEKMADRIVVIGAGIVGVSTALWLCRAGKTVTLIDRLPPGEGTSHGNAGVLAACSIVPVTTPGLVGKSPKLLLDSDFPLFLRWSYLPKLAPWLIKYLSHANDRDTRRIAAGLEHIVGDTVEQHMALSSDTCAEKWVRKSDYIFAYTNRAAYEADSYVWELRRKAGFTCIEVEGDAVREIEPSLGPSITFLAVLKDHGYVLSPGKYVKALAEVFRDMGGEIVQAEVCDFDLSAGRIRCVMTDQGEYPCQSAVLATGVWSKPLAKKLNLSIPLESERGYHIVYKNPSHALKAPVMVASGKFVATPMEEGIRCAGVVEFGGLNAGPSKAPLALLRKKVRDAFPDLSCEEEIEWLGHRPAPSDSLPLIGEIGASGVYSALGHHHIGLTGGPKTGRLVADLITDKGINIDMTPYDPDRFLTERRST